MTWTIRRIADDEADFAALVAIATVVTPEEPTSVEELHWSDATYPGTARFLAELDGRVVAAATVGRIYMRPPDFDGLWATIDVLPAVRRRGIGGGLYDAVAAFARAAGKGALHMTTLEDRPESVSFLEHRRFVEFERMRLVALDLRGGERSPRIPAAAGSHRVPRTARRRRAPTWGRMTG